MGRDEPRRDSRRQDVDAKGGHRAELHRQRMREGLQAAVAAGKYMGRPTYGFNTDDERHLVPNENYSTACDAIEAVGEFGWSKRKAARYSCVPQQTLTSLFERREMYTEVE